MTVLTGSQIPMFRLYALRAGLKAEINGMRLTRGRTCYSIIKQEFNLKGNKQRVFDQFAAIITDIESSSDHESNRSDV